MRVLGFTLGLFLTASCAGQYPASESPQQEQLAKALSAPRGLPEPAYLSGTARAVLRTLMGSHARTMGDLASAIMVLDYPRISAGGRSVAADASLSRPLTGDATELNSALPEAFFQHQDDLRRQAETLAAAAEAQQPFAVSEAYGRLSQTCVNCHATYRAGR